MAGRARPDVQGYSELRAWLDAIDQHRPGHFDRAAIDIGSWSEPKLSRVAEDLEQLSRFLVRAHARLRVSPGSLTSFTDKGRSISLADAEKLLGLTPDEARSGNLTRIVTRGVLLHSDISIMLDDDRDRLSSFAGSGGTPTALIVRDGRQLGLVDRPPHWTFSRTLLELRPEDGSFDEPTRGWYLAVAAFMQSRTRVADLVPHLERARRLFENDPDVLFATAMLHETMASPEVQDAVLEQPLPPGLKPLVTAARIHFGEARTFFRRAVERRPGFTEARIRLGRVLSLLGRHEDAVRELETVAMDGADDRLRYLAALFLGGAREALGRHQAAVESFQRAAALYPAAQSPHVALSRLARASGNHAGAVASLQKILVMPREESAREDPWWRYLRPGETDPAALLSAWRRSAGSEAGR